MRRLKRLVWVDDRSVDSRMEELCRFCFDIGIGLSLIFILLYFCPATLMSLWDAWADLF